MTAPYDLDRQLDAFLTRLGRKRSRTATRTRSPALATTVTPRPARFHQGPGQVDELWDRCRIGDV